MHAERAVLPAAAPPAANVRPPLARAHLQDAPHKAPESGTVRGEGPYPWDRERSGASSSEEEEGGAGRANPSERSEVAAPESGEARRVHGARLQQPRAQTLPCRIDGRAVAGDIRGA